MASKAGEAETNSNDSPTKSGTIRDHGLGGVAGFVFRRVVSLGYCAAFLSLLAQVDGLFGCDAVYPPRAKGLLVGLPFGGVPLAISLVAFVGSLLAGAALLAVSLCEQHSMLTFGMLWVLFASCVELAPALYPQLEDKLLLETGLVALFLVARGNAAFAVTTRGVGKLLAAWLLFRLVFSSGVEKVSGPCEAWRNLSALKNVYQLEAFPLPPAWLLFMAPVPVSQALAFLQLYTELALAPLLLAPWRSVSTSAALFQLLALGFGCFVANKGYSPICQLALVACLLDETWHRGMWSEKLLASWGYRAVALEVDSEDDEEDEEDSPKVAHKEGGSVGIGYAVLVFILVGAGGCAVALNLGTAGLQDEGRSASSALVLAIRITAGIAIALSLVSAARARGGATTGDAGTGRPIIIVFGACLWAFGLLQLSTDVFPTLPWAPLKDIAGGMERVHMAHALGMNADDSCPCPRSEGRLDLVVQGSGRSEEYERTGKAPWLSLSSRFLPSSEERRPLLIQPYVPRLDKELWRLAQKLKPKKSGTDLEVPKWTLRLMSQLSLRVGGSARLSAGSWQGLGVMIHGAGTAGYGSLPTPLPVLYLMRTSSQFQTDQHSNKWWDRKEAKIVRLLEEAELSKLSKKLAPKCEPLPWAEWPVSEAVAALLIAAFVGRVCMPDGKKSKKKKR